MLALLAAALVQVAPLRVAVTELELAGVEARQGRVVQMALLAELRKLEGVSVIGTDEVRAMLEMEANRQLLGCTDSGCLSEIADALGADVMVVGTLARSGESSVFGLKRINQREAKVAGSFDRRFAAGNGEEFLASIGPAVEQLFGELPLRSGRSRGVPRALAMRLNPPPVPAWAFWTGASATAAVGGAAVIVGVLNGAARLDADAYKASEAVDIHVAAAKDEATNQLAYTVIGLGSAAVAGTVATTVAGFFTDFDGYADLDEVAP